MEPLEYTLESGAQVEVSINPAINGDGLVITQHRVSPPKKTKARNTVTCTCTDPATGASYSTTKECPDGNNTCDCSTPSRPVITCG